MAGGSRAPVPVLVVDDDADVREAFALLLDEEGYQTQLAATLEEALAFTDERVFALILTDLLLHTRSQPLDAISRLRDHAHPTPVGVITGWPVSADEVQREGFAFLLPEPFDVEVLLTTIAAALATPLGPAEQRRATVVHRYFDALTARDWEGLLRLCSDDVTYVLPGATPFSTTVQGQAAFRAYTEATFQHYPAARFEAIQVYATPHGLAARFESRWMTASVGEQRQAGSVVFQFADEAICQIGVRMNDERLQALLERRSTETLPP